MVCGNLAVFVSSGCGGCGPARGESELLAACFGLGRRAAASVFQPLPLSSHGQDQ